MPQKTDLAEIFYIFALRKSRARICETIFGSVAQLY
jgi:hypothetical protein